MVKIEEMRRQNVEAETIRETMKDTCTGTTKAGNPCKQVHGIVDGRCHSHRKQVEAPSPEKKAPTNPTGLKGNTYAELLSGAKKGDLISFAPAGNKGTRTKKTLNRSKQIAGYQLQDSADLPKRIVRYTHKDTGMTFVEDRTDPKVWVLTVA